MTRGGLWWWHIFLCKPRLRFRNQSPEIHLHSPSRDVNEIRTWKIRRTHETSRKTIKTSGSRGEKARRVFAASLPIHFWFHSSTDLLAALAVTFFDFDCFSFARRAVPSLTRGSQLSRFFGLKASAARQTLQIQRLVIHREAQLPLLHCCSLLWLAVYTLWDFHFVFNSPRETTRFLSYSYVAGGRVKTLFNWTAHN